MCHCLGLCACGHKNEKKNTKAEDVAKEQSYNYLTTDEMKSLGSDSFNKDKQFDIVAGVNDAVSSKHVQNRLNVYATADNIDFIPTPVIHSGFLVSFLVDAKGGVIRGCRHSGVRVIVPPKCVTAPTRITCRYMRRDRTHNHHPVHIPSLPPLMEGEALASRILELGPTGIKFSHPVTIQVPIFVALRGKEREIVILRCNDGGTWCEHITNVSCKMNPNILDELRANEPERVTSIVTNDFPRYFAIVSRIKQDVYTVGPEGGTVSSSVEPQVQVTFPQGALTKNIKIGLQVQPICVDLTREILGNFMTVSPIVTIEPRRRKFHKPISLTLPLPQAASKGIGELYFAGDTSSTLRLFCSITEGTSQAQWKDITGSTRLTFNNDRVSFITTVSARFWLLDVEDVAIATISATALYQEVMLTPFIAKFSVFAKRIDNNEAILRIFCMTDDKVYATLKYQENFVEVAQSKDIEVLHGTKQLVELSGNLISVTKCNDELELGFNAFHENRLSLPVRFENSLTNPAGRISFFKMQAIQTRTIQHPPICILNIVLPDRSADEADHQFFDPPLPNYEFPDDEYNVLHNGFLSINRKNIPQESIVQNARTSEQMTKSSQHYRSDVYSRKINQNFQSNNINRRNFLCFTDGDGDEETKYSDDVQEKYTHERKFEKSDSGTKLDAQQNVPNERNNNVELQPPADQDLGGLAWQSSQKPHKEESTFLDEHIEPTLMAFENRQLLSDKWLSAEEVSEFELKDGGRHVEEERTSDISCKNVNKANFGGKDNTIPVNTAIVTKEYIENGAQKRLSIEPIKLSNAEMVEAKQEITKMTAGNKKEDVKLFQDIPVAKLNKLISEQVAFSDECRRKKHVKNKNEPSESSLEDLCSPHSKGTISVDHSESGLQHSYITDIAENSGMHQMAVACMPESYSEFQTVENKSVMLPSDPTICASTCNTKGLLIPLSKYEGSWHEAEPMLTTVASACLVEPTASIADTVLFKTPDTVEEEGICFEEANNVPFLSAHQSVQDIYSDSKFIPAAGFGVGDCCLNDDILQFSDIFTNSSSAKHFTDHESNNSVQLGGINFSPVVSSVESCKWDTAQILNSNSIEGLDTETVDATPQLLDKVHQRKVAFRLNSTGSDVVYPGQTDSEEYSSSSDDSVASVDSNSEDKLSMEPILEADSRPNIVFGIHNFRNSEAEFRFEKTVASEGIKEVAGGQTKKEFHRITSQLSIEKMDDWNETEMVAANGKKLLEETDDIQHQNNESTLKKNSEECKK